MLPNGDRLNLKNLFAEKGKPFADEEQNTCLAALLYLPIVRVGSEKGACLSSYIRSVDFCPY